MQTDDGVPWSRQMWPWLLMVPPTASVVAGAFTLYLAITRPDPLLQPDCVRDGVTMRCSSGATGVPSSEPANEDRHRHHDADQH